MLLTYGYITHYWVQLYTYTNIRERICDYKSQDKFYFINHMPKHTGKTVTKYDQCQGIITVHQKWHKRDTRMPFSCMEYDLGIFFTIRSALHYYNVLNATLLTFICSGWFNAEIVRSLISIIKLKLLEVIVRLFLSMNNVINVEGHTYLLKNCTTWDKGSLVKMSSWMR